MVLYFRKYHRMVLFQPNGKKFATLTGGCVPEASTLPPVTVSRFFFNAFLAMARLFKTQFFLMENVYTLEQYP